MGGSALLLRRCTSRGSCCTTRGTSCASTLTLAPLPPCPLPIPLPALAGTESQVQPWTYDRGLDFPGTALADRLDDKGRYLDAPSSTAQQYADLYSSAVEALGPAAMKHLKDILARVENPNALGKQ